MDDLITMEPQLSHEDLKKQCQSLHFQRDFLLAAIAEAEENSTKIATSRIALENATAIHRQVIALLADSADLIREYNRLSALYKSSMDAYYSCKGNCEKVNNDFADADKKYNDALQAISNANYHYSQIQYHLRKRSERAEILKVITELFAQLPDLQKNLDVTQCARDQHDSDMRKASDARFHHQTLLHNITPKFLALRNHICEITAPLQDYSKLSISVLHSEEIAIEPLDEYINSMQDIHSILEQDGSNETLKYLKERLAVVEAELLETVSSLKFNKGNQ